MVLLRCVACVFILVFLSVRATGQDASLLPSLHLELAAAKEDTLRADALARICFNLIRSDPDSARLVGDQALALAKRIKQPRALGDAHNNLGWLAAEQGQFDRADSLLSIALGIFQKLGVPQYTSVTLSNLGWLAEKRGEPGKWAIANTRYFAILTNASGVVVDVNGPIDRSDRRASMITRVGVDLSEASVGTTAIGAALVELQPVWLHRGEHFFADTSVYSCAGAPLFGPDGLCVGMLDLTGIDAVERPELRHLVVRSARSIENALTLRQPHHLLMRINWPGSAFGDESDGLIGLDADGWVTGANPTANQLVPQLVALARERIHSSDLFALPFEMLFDAARRAAEPMELPLWSGLRLRALAQVAGAPPPVGLGKDPVPLKDVEITLIRKAVADAKGNVQQAARALGISRATVYRKLGAGRAPR